ncbi:MAG: hypothetical protein ACR2QG_12740 [Gammaproteobacteria bacterium]
MRMLIAIIGFCAGCAAALAALLLNPLAQPVQSMNGSETYDLSPLEFHGAELNDVLLLNLPVKTSGIPFAAENMTHSNASIVVLRNTDGEAVALGTRLVMAGDDSDLLSAQLNAQAYTNIFWPNRGSIMMFGRENRWAVLQSYVLEGKGNADSTWEVSVMPMDGSLSGIIGGSGAFESIGGTYTEILKPNPRGDGTFVGKIALEKTIR